MANRYPNSNDAFNQFSPLYQPGTSMNFTGSGSAEFLQFPRFYYMQQNPNPTVQTPSPLPSPSPSPSTSLPTEPSNPGPSTQKSRERWQTRDEAVLVQLWADNIERLESKDSRKAWDEIVRALNEKQGITKTVDQCQRKLKHLKNLYKEKKDWNRKQSGGNIRKSPHYDAIDAVLGCRDVITCNKLRQVGITTPEPALDAEHTPEGRSTPLPATPSSTNSESSAETTRRKERKNQRKRPRAAESDSEDEGFKDALKKLSSADDSLSRAIEGMENAQAQQNQLMTQLLGSFNRYMDAKTSKKE